MVMDKFDAAQFWLRYKKLAAKDLPVLVKTGISQPTLSSWRRKRLFPRADEAYRIAQAINTSIEYLVSGQDGKSSLCSASAMEIAMNADKLSEEGLNVLRIITQALEAQYAK